MVNIRQLADGSFWSKKKSMEVQCHIRIFIPGGGWITATATDDPQRVCDALSHSMAVVSYTVEGEEFVEETSAYLSAT